MNADVLKTLIAILHHNPIKGIEIAPPITRGPAGVREMSLMKQFGAEVVGVKYDSDTQKIKLTISFDGEESLK